MIDGKIVKVHRHGQGSKRGPIDLIHSADYLITDKGYDAEQIRVSSRNRKIIPIIPLISNSKKSNPDFDK